MSEKFEQMSVMDLRKVAKEMGVKLGAGINKQGIIEKLMNAEAASAPAPAVPAPSAPAARPVRTAAIITDDGTEDEDDVPVLTPNLRAPKPAQRPVPAGTSAGASSLSTISAKAPAFTTEGSRAWHNPRPYQNSTPSYQRNQPAGWGAPRPAQPAAARRTYTAQQPQQPVQRPAPTYPHRFGPEQTAAAEPAAQPASPVQDYRPAAAYRQDYQPAEPAQPAAPQTYQEGPAPGPTLQELLTAGDVGDGEGVMELHPDGYGVLRTAIGKKDIYISNAQIRRFSLRTGDYILGKTRPQRENDRYTAMLYITEINGHVPEEMKNRPVFENFTTIYPRKRINLSGRSQDPALWMIDLFSPIGFGQRALITCAPGAPKTEMMKKLAAAVARNYPKAQVKVLLTDEQPEEVTELSEAMKAEVTATTFDQAPEAQMKSFDLCIERAKRLVEDGRDVVLLLDSLTRMARVCNQTVPAASRTLEGGLAAGAMLTPKRFFGAARNTREGGTLTVIAFAVDGNPFSNAVLEEIRGGANMELYLKDASVPGFDPLAAKTKKDELMLSDKEKDVIGRIRGMLADLPPQDALAQLLSMLEKVSGPDELIERFDGWMNL